VSCGSDDRLSNVGIPAAVAILNSQLAGPLKAAAKELRAGGGNRQSSAGEGGSPVVSFVELERSAAVTLIETVNATLAAIGRLLRGQDTLSPAVQVG
jgi:hypothetical protein